MGLRTPLFVLPALSGKHKPQLQLCAVPLLTHWTQTLKGTAGVQSGVRWCNRRLRKLLDLTGTNTGLTDRDKGNWCCWILKLKVTHTAMTQPDKDKKKKKKTNRQRGSSHLQWWLRNNCRGRFFPPFCRRVITKSSDLQDVCKRNQSWWTFLLSAAALNFRWLCRTILCNFPRSFWD